MSTPIHLQPTAELAERVLLPGDPGRALLLAQELLAAPKMFNHHRGLWGYSGPAADGEQLTIQSTGMGGPSAAIVISELVDLGARCLVRVGTCGALDSQLELGDLVAAEFALAEDGTSRALGADGRVRGDAELSLALAAAGEARSLGVASTDLFYGSSREDEDRWLAQGAGAVEMESATLFALAGQRRVAAGSLLIVSDVLRPQRRRIGPEALKQAEVRMGALALSALTKTPFERSGRASPLSAKASPR